MSGIFINPSSYAEAPLLVHIDAQNDVLIKHEAEY